MLEFTVFRVVSGGTTEGNKNNYCGLTASRTKAVIIVPTHHNFKLESTELARLVPVCHLCLHDVASTDLPASCLTL